MSVPHLPLAGVTVIDLTWAAVGPYAAYLLAGLGAEVIHIERPNAATSGRATASLYRELNAGKTIVGIDIKQPQGRDLVRRLLREADVYLENFRPGVVERLGLGWSDASAENPKLVMLSASAMGRQRVASSYVGYAPIFCALSGLAYLTGYPDGPPVEIRQPADFTVGAVAGLAILAGLARARRTGAGCYIDCAAREALAWSLSHALVVAQAFPSVDLRVGNGDRHGTVHGVYRCRGDNSWVTIAVDSDDEWMRLCEALGDGELARLREFRTGELRRAHRAEIDALLEGWTRARTPAEVTEVLQAHGVAAFPSMTNRDLWSDRHVHARRMFERIGAGKLARWAATPPWVIGGTERRLPETLEGRAADEAVFKRRLGLRDEEIERLRGMGVVG